MLEIAIPGAGELSVSTRAPCEQLAAFARSSSEAPLARYPTGCLRRGELPAGWLVNHSEQQIGSGRAAFKVPAPITLRAKHAAQSAA